MSKPHVELLYQRKYAGVGAPPETEEFCVRVYPDEFEQWKKDPTSIAIVEVVEAPEVFIGSHKGTYARPSHAQLMDAMNSTDFDECFKFMAQHGTIKRTGKHTAMQNDEKGMEKQKSVGVGASHGSHGYR